MINFASYPVTLAGSQFSYLTKELDVIESLEIYERTVVADLTAEWRETIDGLALAFEAAGERALVTLARELSEAHPLDWDTRSGLIGVLRLAGEPYQDAVERLAEIDDILADSAELQALAWDRRHEAIGAARADGFPIELREDTSKELRELLSIGAGETLERSEVRHLMFNRTAEGEPIPGKYYAKRQSNAEPTAYFGLTFSAGKSVSVRMGFANRAEKMLIIEAHNLAVDKTLRALEGDIAWVRRGERSDRRERGEMTWIKFRHEVGRRGDPQLHTHVVVPNVVRSLESESVGSLDTRRAQGRINALHRVTYHQELARNLREVGIAATFTNKGGVPEAVVDGIDPAVTRALSQRREEAVAKAAELVGGDLSAVSDYARKRVVNGAAKHLRPRHGEYHGDRATWEKRLEQHARKEWHGMVRTQGWVSGSAGAYLDARTKEDKAPVRRRTRTPVMGIGHEPSGGGGPRHRFVREQEHEQ